ncbi:hypothetical protein BVRB_7g168110 [Beta vulgaris subsp. vulgaris]|uniref:Uncharacterized protein n=1 Tax=Beta vulgaris subsp. vulgaris TaxID=3555 RepID=A0A0J8BVE3_BETVV|nr:hypothetical protein BVRB_7g168110 [Beta vulgaris subsp. vulgaris]
MKPTFVVFFGLLISIGMIANNQVACTATSNSDPCKKPNPPPHCLSTLAVDPCKKPNPPPHCTGSYAKKPHHHRGCSKLIKCQKY